MKRANRRGKRYYKVGETVYIKSEKTLGVIVSLTVKPEEQVYQALVQYKDGNETVTRVFALWEIDKNKVEMYKDKRKGERSKAPTVLFAKVRESAIIPSKEDENAGYDIYANFDEDYIIIHPQQVALIPTGIASSVTDDYALIAKERGSTGTKGMAVRAGVVDSGYRGEIFIAISNVNDKFVVIAKNPKDFETHSDAIVYPYSKAIAQLLLVGVPKASVKEIPFEELKAIPSKRGATKLGQSGK